MHRVDMSELRLPVDAQPQGPGIGPVNEIDIEIEQKSLMQRPAPVRVARITEQDLEILLEGAHATRHSARRDICIGVFASLAPAAISIFLSTDLVVRSPAGAIELNIAGLVSAFLFSTGATTSFILALLSHSAASVAKARTSYERVVDRVRSELAPQSDLPPGRSLPRPQQEYLAAEPVRIHDATTKIKIEPRFLEWPEFTVAFWVNIDESFLRTDKNRYLFSHTSAPPDEPGHNYPNALYLGLRGGGQTWQLACCGDDHGDAHTITFPASLSQAGWKFFCVRLSRTNSKISISVDAGSVLQREDLLNDRALPRRIDGHLFYLGGWRDTYLEGTSGLQFRYFRIYDRWLPNEDVQRLFELERGGWCASV